MDIIDVIKKRRSVREFKDSDVPDDVIKEIIELAKLCPSAGNLQSYKVVIQKGKDLKFNAPVNLIICADTEKSATKYGNRGMSLYSVQDATIFASYVQLVAVNFGLASVWVGAFNEGTYALPSNLRPIAVICLGYPKDDKNRREYKDIIHE